MRRLSLILLVAFPAAAGAQTPVRPPAPVLSQVRPPAPDSVRAKESEPGVVTIEWSAVPGAKDYYLWKERRPNGARSLGIMTGTRYVDRDVKPGITYSYTVAARSSALVRGWPRSSGDIVPGSGGSVVAAGAAPVADSARPAIVNPQITTPVTATSNTTPVVLGPPPAGAESLASPPADTTPCLSATASADTSGAREQLDARSARIDARSTTTPTGTVDPTAPTGEAPGSATYREGKCRNGSATGYPELWDAVAAASGLSTADQVAAWKEIGVVALAYRHLLERQPTPEETRRDVAALKSGTTWRQLWRRIAQSSERDSRFGYWAPAPLASAAEAQQVFGIASASQQCFGGLGPKCAGGIPDAVNGKVYPSWFGSFRMPDNTSMGYVEIGVAVGSILHDNACLRDMSGLNCNGLGAGDLIKVGGFPAVMEWNKASWNVIDQRTWRATFGPYPTALAEREAQWYDDIRPTSNRLAMMAPTISMLTFPGLTEYYRGGETKRSRALKAPAGTSLDDTDVQFCASGAFGSRGVAPFKASWGICK